MGKFSMLLRSAAKKQRGTLVGLLVLMLLSGLFLAASLTLSYSGREYIAAEMERLGFGDLTVWTQGAPKSVSDELTALPDVASVSVQPLIFADYAAGARHSDDEGQLLFYDDTVPYRFLTAQGDEIPTPQIKQGTVYVSPAMAADFGVTVGDTITFQLSRSRGQRELTVAGFFADPFMGSSMIDMKSFLLCKTDWAAMSADLAAASEADVLAKQGAMLHITQAQDSTLTAAQFSQLLQESTQLPRYTAFTYRQESIASYMLLLQNLLSGFLLAFSLVLLAVCLILTGHSLWATLQQERRDMAILRTMGLSGGTLRMIYLILYGGAASLGLIFGLLFHGIAAQALVRAMVFSTGMLIETRSPWPLLLAICVGMLVLFTVFLLWSTRRILHIPPMQSIREAAAPPKVVSPLRKRLLPWDLAIRELRCGKGNYMALLCIAALLALFLSIVGRMGSWLGPNGEGLMNAFSVADHDIGVQPFNDTVPMDEIRRAVEWYSPIKDTYELAMEPVTVNGQEYTANVLNDTSWFHLLSGKLCDGDSILITDTVARELGLSIGDTVTVAAGGLVETYTVSGIYQCANGMGSNIGMSLAGYSKIGDVTGHIWCYHYILEDGSVRDYAMTYLQSHYQGIDVHTNSWSGLDSIVLVMHAMVAVLYLVAAALILIGVALTAGRLLAQEMGTMAVYKSLGMPVYVLRLSFALRFLVTSLLGTLVGVILSMLVGNRLIGSILQSFGIGDFHAGVGFLSIVLPLLVVPALFFAFAWRFSAKLSRVNMVRLLTENEE